MKFSNSIKNVIWAIVYQALFLIFGFVIRKLLLNQVGIYLIGVNGVFENIISMLMLMNFGIGPASMYFLYKSFSNGDYKKASEYYWSFTKLFRYVALIIFVLGLFFVFKIDWIISTENGDIFYLRLFFFVHILKACSSFLITTPRYTLQCDEKRYYNLAADSVALVLFGIIKCFSLIYLKSYIIYLLLSLLEMIFSNLYIYICFAKQYKRNGKITKSYSKKATSEVFVYSKKIAITNVNDFINNCTDNIVISKICGTLAVGYMSTYYLIVEAVKGFVTQTFSSIEATFVKRFNLSYSQKDTIEIYNLSSLLSYLVSSFVLICLYALTNSFIDVYFGKDYAIGNRIPLLMAINLAILILQYPSDIFLTANGLKDKVVSFSTFMIVANISLSIILAKLIGVEGVLYGTIVANLIMFFGQEIIVKRMSNLLTLNVILNKVIYIVLIVTQVIIAKNFIALNNSFINLVKTFFECFALWTVFSIPFIRKIVTLIKFLIYGK